MGQINYTAEDINYTVRSIIEGFVLPGRYDLLESIFSKSPLLYTDDRHDIEICTAISKCLEKLDDVLASSESRIEISKKLSKMTPIESKTINKKKDIPNLLKKHSDLWELHCA